MSTKITTPVLIDLPGETLSSENTAGVVLPKGIGGIETLIVAGGGGSTTLCGSGGGGAGGVLKGFLKLALSTGYSIQVGAGGTGSTGPGYSTGYTNGSNSFISSWIANGGGYSAGACCISIFVGYPSSGNTGGSGGGGGGYSGNGSATVGGSANQTNISPLTGYGNDGGNHVYITSGVYSGAGGGGAGGAGQDCNATVTSAGVDPGIGGGGIISTIIDTTIASTNSVGEVSGSDVYFAGGGGGSNGNGVAADGGLGGGGTGITNGTAATGGGAGGATCGGSSGQAGGSGVIILKYPDTLTCTLTSNVGLTEIVDTTSVAGFKISIFKVSSEGTDGTGTITFTGTTTIPLSASTGEFRYNTSDKLVEFYNGSAWKQIADEYISGQPTTCVCNYPTTATALYQLEDNTNDTCGNYNATNTTDITYNSSGKFGKSAVFNGTSSYFKLPFASLGADGGTNPATNTPFTISMWLKFDDLASERYIFSKYENSGGGTYGMSCQSPLGASTITFTAYNTGNTGYSVVTTTSMSTGVWYNYVLTFDFDSAITAYLNGSQEATTTPSGTFGQNPETVYIGRYWNGATYFDGEMDQIRLFPSALSASQVTELYNEVACT